MQKINDEAWERFKHLHYSAEQAFASGDFSNGQIARTYFEDSIKKYLQNRRSVVTL